MAIPFILPELGENIAGGDVLRVLVSPGDTVARDQPVLELETDKATIEVPSSVAGRVVGVMVKAGDKVQVGDVVLVVEGADAPTEAPEAVDGPTGLAREAQQPSHDLETTSAEPAAGAAAHPPAPAGPVEVRIPELGENVTSGDVLHVLVKAGDVVKRDQPILELETDKATLEVPSPVAGRVLEVRVKEGETVAVGAVVFVAEPDGAVASRPLPLTVERVHAAAPPAIAAAPLEDKAGMLEDALAELQAEAQLRSRPASVVPMPQRESDAERRAAPAAPSVRRVARELGVDINQVAGTGPGGRIAADDVTAYVKRTMSSGGPRPSPPVPAGGASSPHPPGLPDFSKWGPVERQPMRAVRRKTAEHLSRAWATIPHVTQFDRADLTAVEQLRQRHGKRIEEAGGRLTVTAVALKVVAAALKVFPQFNASLDPVAEEVVLKKYIHIGVAVDTDRGLIVPVIRDVDTKSIRELSVELVGLSERARTRKTTLDEMEGGSFTISNLGGIGGTHFTPIVNHPEVAILGLSRSRIEPVFVDGEFRPRLMLPLSLSYDHRLIDGADGIRFLRWVAEALEQPVLLSLHA